ncbi:MAG: hypothetical protein O2958_10650 [Gemmatimonadetes bacterium]|nr:hypothetical protein [Gemmatimonadota bacterium]
MSQRLPHVVVVIVRFVVVIVIVIVVIIIVVIVVVPIIVVPVFIIDFVVVAHGKHLGLDLIFLVPIRPAHLRASMVDARVATDPYRARPERVVANI